MGMMMTTSKSEVTVAMAMQRKGLIERTKREGQHHSWAFSRPSCSLDVLTAQGEVEMDRQNQGENAQRGGKRKMLELAGKVGEGLGGYVHPSFSAVSRHSNYRTSFCFHRWHISIARGLSHAPAPRIHALWRLHLSVKVKACPAFSHP